MEMAKKELSQWVDLYSRELFVWAFKRLSDDELAKDLVQDTFLAAAEKLETFKKESSPKTWLFSILNHKIADHYRAKIKQPIKLEEQTISRFFDEKGDWRMVKRPQEWQEDESNILDDSNFLEILRKCLDELPDKWNTCVQLKYLLNKNSGEICQELDLNPTNYWQIMHRAKLSLRECIEMNWFRPDENG